MTALEHGGSAVPPRTSRPDLALLADLQRQVLWLSSWIVHHANHVRPNRDGLKVGGHQASCASIASVMTALYFGVLRREDRVAVKPHAAPVHHAIQYLLGRQTREQLERFRVFGGAQSYPSRTKDRTDVDFSTGSVGLGVAATLFASLVRDYVRLHGFAGSAPAGRMIALVGDAELDEGNVFEALVEGWKHDVRDLWWIIDYNRQSLDGVVNDTLFSKIRGFFENVGWRVVLLKHGRLQEAARNGPAGEALIDWIDACPNQLYAALTFQGGASWRAQLRRDLSGVAGASELLDSRDDEALHALMTNLGGHDLETLTDAFSSVDDDRPTCFVVYTTKGHGLPFAGHKDNHAGLMNEAQMRALQESLGVPAGAEWEPFSAIRRPAHEVRAFLDGCQVARPLGRLAAAPVPVHVLRAPDLAEVSTQDAFGRLLAELGREDTPLSRHIVTTSPDVTLSTNLGGWVNRRGVFHLREIPDVFRVQRLASSQKWDRSPHGQHIELGIAENNLFLLLGQLGLASELAGVRLLPVGTVYDPFVNRGLDALIYACYQGARFIVVGTPSGVTLAPEGGAHQSINTPLVGIAQDGLTYFEPAYADELAVILGWAFEHVQAADGGSVYLRLSTRAIPQPRRALDEATRDALLRGAYWVHPPRHDSETVLVGCGVVAPEVLEAQARLALDLPGTAVLAVTSPDRLFREWRAACRERAAGRPGARSHVESLLDAVPLGASLVTVMDGHPASLAWMGGVRGHATRALGVSRFGQSGDIPDTYAWHGLDAPAIVDAVAEAFVARRNGAAT